MEVDSVEWRRRLMRVFKDSSTDNAYSKLLEQYTPDEQQRITRFLEGEDPKDISQGFVLGPSLGCRHEMAEMKKAHAAVVVSPEGIRPLIHSVTNSLVNGKDHHENIFTKIIHDIHDFFHQKKKASEKVDEITVRLICTVLFQRP